MTNHLGVLLVQDDGTWAVIVGLNVEEPRAMVLKVADGRANRCTHLLHLESCPERPVIGQVIPDVGVELGSSSRVPQVPEHRGVEVEDTGLQEVMLRPTWEEGDPVVV